MLDGAGHRLLAAGHADIRAKRMRDFSTEWSRLRHSHCSGLIVARMRRLLQKPPAEIGIPDQTLIRHRAIPVRRSPPISRLGAPRKVFGID